MNFSRIKNARNRMDNMDPQDRISASLPDLSFDALDKLLADFASAFTQENRLVRLQIGDGNACGELLLAQSVEGAESLSACYKYVVTCLSPDAFIPLGAASPAKTGNEETENESNISRK